MRHRCVCVCAVCICLSLPSGGSIAYGPLIWMDQTCTNHFVPPFVRLAWLDTGTVWYKPTRRVSKSVDYSLDRCGDLIGKFPASFSAPGHRSRPLTEQVERHARMYTSSHKITKRVYIYIHSRNEKLFRLPLDGRPLCGKVLIAAKRANIWKVMSSANQEWTSPESRKGGDSFDDNNRLPG